MLRGESHPAISLQADADLIAKSSPPTLLPPSVLASVQTALGAPDAPRDVKNEALRAVMQRVGEKYKYRLPDATARKDIEYYRDAAHRGYLSHTVAEGQGPSLFFKPPGEAKDRRERLARRAAAKASAENRLF